MTNGQTNASHLNQRLGHVYRNTTPNRSGIIKKIYQAKCRLAGHPAQRTDKRWKTSLMAWQPRTGRGEEAEEDGGMTFDLMQEQYGQEQLGIEINGIFMRRAASYTG